MSNNWKNKILNHEETPPDGVWDSISKKMDEDEVAASPDFVARLNAYKATPPLAVWENIVNELEEDGQTTPVTVQKSKLVILYRSIAVAASVLIIIATIFLLNNKRSSTAGEAVAKNIPEKVKPAIINNTDTTNGPIITPAPGKDNITASHIPRQHKAVTYKDIVTDNSIAPIAYTKTEVVPAGNNPFADNKEKIQNTAGNIITDLDHLGTPNTYVMASLGPNGETVRISTKLSGYISYLNDKNPDTEEYLDKIIKESAIWKTRLKQWSDKLINNTVSPSVSNYFDVFELSNLLDEKNK